MIKTSIFARNQKPKHGGNYKIKQFEKILVIVSVIVILGLAAYAYADWCMGYGRLKKWIHP